MRLWVGFFRGLAFAGCVLGGVAAGSVGSALLTATSAYAQIATVVVEGNRRVEADTIRSYFRSSSGRLDAAAIGIRSSAASEPPKA